MTKMPGPHDGFGSNDNHQDIRHAFHETVSIQRQVAAIISELSTRLSAMEARIETMDKILIHGEPGRESVVVTLRLLTERLLHETTDRVEDVKSMKDEKRDRLQVRTAIMVAIVAGIFGLAAAAIALLKHS